MGAHYLDRLFAPRSIAVFGASARADAVGTVVFRNLLEAGFRGELHAINPKYESVQGRPCHPDIEHLGHAVDLAVIATPARGVPEIVRRCGEAGVRAAVILSAGFGESGAEGERLEAELLEHAQRLRMRIVGPNCLGIIRPELGLNATFSNNQALTGHMAFVSQSGALCTAVLDWAEQHGIGFSAIVSLGDAADVDFGDVLSYLALDPQTRSILLYVEGLRNARGFLSGLRIAARLRPVVVVKAGRHAEGSRAAVSHTGAMVGGDDVFHAALRRAGAVRAYTFEQLFSAAAILSSRPYRINGNRLAIVTNGGGPGVMAADHAVEMQVAVAGLGPDTLAALDAALPPHWSHGNPVDVLGDAGPERYRRAVELCLADPNVDGVLAMLTPQAMTRPLAAAETVVEAAKTGPKPVLTCWMGGHQVDEARALFDRQQIAHFDTPEASVEAFSYLASYRLNQELLMQVPDSLGRRSEPDREGAQLIIQEALGAGRSLLTPLETQAVLKAFGVPVLTSIAAGSANEALVVAESLGFPVAMKIHSPDITHKSDVSGVRLNIRSAAAVRATYNDLLAAVRDKRPEAKIQGVIIEPMHDRPHGRELIVGVVRDPVFGPAIGFGAGGTAVEVMQDRFVSLPPLNRVIAAQMIERTRVSRLLGNFRHMPAVNREALENVLLRVSELVCELPEVIELDINPLIVDERDAVAVDARMTVAQPPPSARRYAHMAIHPYPSHLVQRRQLSDGTEVVYRPIRPEDSGIEQDFVRRLSPRSKYFRFMRVLHELNREMLVRFTQIDYDQEMALIAVIEQDGREVEVGVARYATGPDGKSCEFAIVVADEWRRRGIGFHLMSQLMAIARARGLETMESEVLTENTGMLGLVQRLGFAIKPHADDPGIRWVTRRLNGVGDA
ncbi:MAG TPA: bifunctional acetate--CoA ligase family protein/GNAT family N-acetyltransferase [Acidiferrobacterales bacterium]